MERGSQYKSYSLFLSAFQEFKEETYSVWRTHKSTSSKSQNKKLKGTLIDTQIFPFAHVKFVCVHHGVPKPRGTGVRTFTRFLASACPAELTVVYNARIESIMIVKAELTHNHALDPSLARLYVQNRCLNQTEVEQLGDVMSLQPKNQALLQFIREHNGKGLTMKDIQNLKARHKKMQSNLKDDDQLIYALDKVLQVEDGRCDLSMSDAGDLQVLLIQTHTMKALLSKFPEVVHVDATYKVNNCDYPMFIFMVHDGMGRGRTVAFAFVRNESKANICYLMKAYKEFSDTDPQTFIIDKDFTELAIIQECFPSSHIVLCRFHVLRIFNNKINKLQLTDSGGKKELLAKVKKMTYCSEEEYNAIRLQLPKISPSFYEYFVKNWESCSNLWAKHKLPKGLFGNYTNNRVESENQKLKTILSRHTSVGGAVLNVLQFNRALDKERAFKLFRETCSSLHYPGVRALQKAVLSKLTQYASELVIKESQKVETVSRSPVAELNHCFTLLCGKTEYTIQKSGACSCDFSQTYLLPCRHALYLLESGIIHEEQLLASIPNRWKKEYQSLHTESWQWRRCTVNTVPLQKQRKILSEQEKYRLALVNTNELASLLSRSGHVRFQSRLSTLSTIISAWRTDRDVTVSIVDSMQSTAEDDSEKDVYNHFDYKGYVSHYDPNNCSALSQNQRTDPCLLHHGPAVAPSAPDVVYFDGDSIGKDRSNAALQVSRNEQFILDLSSKKLAERHANNDLAPLFRNTDISESSLLNPPVEAANTSVNCLKSTQPQQACALTTNQIDLRRDETALNPDSTIPPEQVEPFPFTTTTPNSPVSPLQQLPNDIPVNTNFESSGKGQNFFLKRLTDYSSDQQLQADVEREKSLGVQTDERPGHTITKENNLSNLKGKLKLSKVQCRGRPKGMSKCLSFLAKSKNNSCRLTDGTATKREACRKMWVEEPVSLTFEDSAIITSNQWLTSDIIHAAQLILKSQYNDIEGLQHPGLSYSKRLSTPNFETVSGAFVQILHIADKSHWVCAANTITSNSDDVVLCNSLCDGTVHSEVVSSVSSLFRAKEGSFLHFKVLPVDQQPNSYDCGIAAIAYATLLCQRKDPTKAYLQWASIRGHLINCIETRKMVDFPSKERIQGSVTEVQVARVYCVCRETKRGHMVECDHCHEWFHKRCVYKQTDPDVWDTVAVKWFCAQCRRSRRPEIVAID